MKPAASSSTHRAARLTPLVVAVSSVLAASLSAEAQQVAPSGNLGLDEIIVTAQKRSENMQTVPISIQAIDTKKLSELQVTSFQDYVRYLPSLSAQSFGPGQSQLYMRGITNGGDGVHSGPSPMVGVYLDEMPVTTISENLDIHVYDMARVEALSGPQGTLFGANSLAGTLRLITNKPEIGLTKGAVDVTGTYFTSSNDPGGKLEGFVNLPVSDQMAVRLVGWAEHDGGYINNVRSSYQVYPTSGIRRDNANLTEKASNTVDTVGGRAALKLIVNDAWTISPTLMAQNQTVHGQYAYTPFATHAQATYADGSTGPAMTLGGTGDLNTSRYLAEVHYDRWVSGALVVEGKVGDFDITYAGGYIKRNVYDLQDYSDYTLFYDVQYAGSPGYFGNNFVDKNHKFINPGQYVYGRNHFTKQSNELRIATPTSWTLHGVLGVFSQRQSNELQYGYNVDGLTPEVSAGGQPGTLWYQHAFRTDRDTALFTDWTYDVTSKFALTAGVRFFHYDNTVNGFFGFGLGYPTYGLGLPTDNSQGGAYNGENLCVQDGQTVDPTNKSLPCQNLNFRATKSSQTHRINATYKFNDDVMVYGTYSTGFRPGGINRIPAAPAFQPDYLSNYEIGIKSSWFEHRLRANLTAFYEDWKDAQFGYAGPQAVSIFVNAGKAKSQGIEGDLMWRATQGLTLSTAFTLDTATLQSDVCKFATSADKPCPSPGNKLLAPNGSRLPVSSKFKANAIARYEWSIGDTVWHAQTAAVYQTDAFASLRTSEQQVIGKLPAYASFDFAIGNSVGPWSTELSIQNVADRRGEVNRYTTCVPATCSLINVIPIKPRLLALDIGYKF